MSAKKSGPGADWNRIETEQPTLPVTDLAEQFVRLQHGLGSLHRGGRVCFATTFADGKAEVLYGAVGGGTGGAYDVDTTKAEYGKQSLKLTHGNIIGAAVDLQRGAAVAGRSKLGLEWSGQCGFGANAGRLYATIESNAADDYTHRYKLRFDYTAADTKIYREEGGQTLLFTLDPMYDVTMFYQYKMVVDDRIGGTPKYDKLYINGQVFDLSSYGASFVAKGAGGPPRVTFKFGLYAQVAQNLNYWMGSWIFTTDEI